MHRSIRFPIGTVVLVLLGCDTAEPANGQQRAAGADPDAARAACTVVSATAPLPGEVRETSGLAPSEHADGGFWTHNDAGNDPVLFRITAAGALAQTVAIEGATLEDWEDIDAAPCDGEACLFVGDIGDNDAARDLVTVYRLREPASDATTTSAERVHLRYPDGPRDAESLFVDGSGTLHIVTKGRDTDIALYRASPAAWDGRTIDLVRVRRLFAAPQDEDDRVTAATLTPDNRWVAVRSYRSLHLYPFDALTSEAEVVPVSFDLTGLGEAQGESIVMTDDGTVWMTSEAEDRGTAPSWMQLRCPLPGAS